MHRMPHFVPRTLVPVLLLASNLAIGVTLVDEGIW